MSSPSPLPRLRANVLEAWALWTGIDSGLFQACAEPISRSDLLKATRFAPSALDPLVGALEATGHIDRVDDTLVVSDASAPFVLGSVDAPAAEAPQFIGRSFGFLRTSRHFESYPGLLQHGGQTALSPADWGHITLGSSAYVAPAVDAMCRLVPALNQGCRVLDVGCGSGDYSLALLDRNPALEVLAIDPTPVVAERTGARLADRSRAEVRCCELGDVGGTFDVVLLNHVLHVVGDAASVPLLRQCRERLTPGGVLVVQELVKTPQNRAELFGLMMRMLFQDGQAFDESELRHQLHRAGFDAAEAFPIGAAAGGLTLLVASTPPPKGT